MKKIAYILGIICAMTMQSCLDLEPKNAIGRIPTIGSRPNTSNFLPPSSMAGRPTFDGSTTVSTPIFARICLPAAR